MAYSMCSIMNDKIEALITAQLCNLFGHKLLMGKYSFYDYQNGRTTWVQECKRCHCAIYCTKGFVRKKPTHIFKISLNTPITVIENR